MAGMRAFPTGGIVPPEDLVGREPALNDFLERVYRQGNSIALAAPRQTGKTSVVTELLRRVREADGWGVYIDCQMATDADDFAALVASSTYDQASGSKGAFARLRDLLRALPIRPAVFQSDADIAITFHSERRQVTTTQKLHQALVLADRLAAEKDKRMVVVYDEFPLLRKISPKIFDQIRSSLQTANTHTAYVFMGSEVGMLEELFASRRRSPFRLATITHLPPPTEQEWTQYIERRFAELGHRLSSGEAASLVTFTQGQPRALMGACQELLALRRVRSAPSADDVTLAQARTLDELRVHFEDLWRSLDEPEGARVIASRIATGQGVYRRSRLHPPQVMRALNKLEHEGIIRRVSRGTYEFTDPLFARFVRDMSDRT